MEIEWTSWKNITVGLFAAVSFLIGFLLASAMKEHKRDRPTPYLMEEENDRRGNEA